MAVSAASAQSVVYVSAEASGSGTGASWADAFADLGAALAASAPGSEIWLAEGTYRPTTGEDRAVSFALRPGVAVYGGFAGTESSRAARDWARYPTVLTGEIGSAGVGDNAYHVVTGPPAGAPAVLDGVTVTGGNALGNSEPLGDLGGGLLVTGGTVSVRNVTFKGNVAAGGGAAAHQSGATVTYLNCVFAGNISNGTGGAVLTGSGAASSFAHATFTANTAAQGGGAIASAGGTVEIANSILWANSGDEVLIQGGGTVDISDSIVEEGYPEGTGIVDADPNLDPSSGRIPIDSPARDLGSLTRLPRDTDDADGDGVTDEPYPYDIARQVRLRGNAPDAGAFEAVAPDCPGGSTLFVDRDAAGAGTGASWDDAFRTLNAALEAADRCPVTNVWVAQGVYTPSPTGDLTASFTLRSGLALYGGFVGTEGSPSERNTNARSTLSGPAHHVVSAVGLTAPVTLDGFIITGGDARDAPTTEGGGLRIEGSDVTVSNATFWRNHARQGGGLSVTEGTLVLDRVSIDGNRATRGGGLAVSASGEVRASRTLFTENEVGTGDHIALGGAVYALGNADFVSCRFQGNENAILNTGPSGRAYGGGIYGSNASLLVVNTVFDDNLANADSNVHPSGVGRAAGSGVYLEGGGADFVHATFARNRWYSSTLAVDDGHLRLDNSIVWGNAVSSASFRPPVTLSGEASIEVANTIVEGGVPGTDALDRDPRYLNPDVRNFRLAPDSPAANAGRLDLLPPDTADLDEDGDTTEPLPLDLDGGPRVVATVPDLGAYESNVPLGLADETAPRMTLVAGPNPFAASSLLRIQIPAPGRLTVRLYDALGRRVSVLADLDVSTGEQVVPVEGAPLASGVYVVRVDYGIVTQTLRLVRR